MPSLGKEVNPSLMKTLLLLSLSVTLSLPGVSQDQPYRVQRAEFAMYNMGMGALAGGVGAWVNKEKEQKWHRVFFKGMAQGLLGGYLMHQGKNLTYQIYAQERYAYAWPAHLVHAAGASIVQNAASNRNFWEHWHINLWLLRLDYDLPDRRFQARVFPSGVYGYFYLHKDGNLSLSKSLKTGFIFLENKSAKAYGGRAAATTMAVEADEFNYTRNYQYEVTAHEVVHSLQYEGAVYFNPLLNKADAKWKEKFRWYKTLSRFIYFDFNGIYDLISYELEGWTNNPCYWDNFFEKEAEHYGNRKYLSCP